MPTNGMCSTGAAEWRLLIDDAADAAWNMAADEAMLRMHAVGKIPPTLRFYSWQPRAVSLGYFQQARREVDFEECEKRGIRVVRRLSGGRTVLHDREVTYSLVVKESESYVPEGVTASYLYFSRGIASGLTSLGLDPRLHSPRPTAGISSAAPLHSAACFDAPSHYELTVGGRKIVGSAQTRRDGVLLQHGSILLDFDPESLVDVFAITAEEGRRKLLAELSRRAAGLNAVAGKQFEFMEVASAVASGISAQCGLCLKPAQRDLLELKLVQELEQKYRSQEWTLRR